MARVRRWQSQSQMAIASDRLINSLKLFFDVIVEFEFIGARQSATTRSILFPHTGRAPRSTSRSRTFWRQKSRTNAHVTRITRSNIFKAIRKCYFKKKKKKQKLDCNNSRPDEQLIFKVKWINHQAHVELVKKRKESKKWNTMSH